MSRISVDVSRCDLCGLCVDACPFGDIDLKNGAIGISEECRMCLQCIGACPRDALCLTEGQAPSRGKPGSSQLDSKKHSGVMVVAQSTNGAFDPVTYELVGKGNELAAKAGVKTACVVAGYRVTVGAAELLSYGVDRVLVYDHPALKHFRGDVYADVMEDAVLREKPGVLLLGATPEGRSLAPRLAVRLRTGLTADCTSLDIEPNGDLVQTRPAFGGNIMATIVTPNMRPQMATVRPKVMPKPERMPGHNGHLRQIDIDASGLARRIPALLLREEVLEERGIAPAESIADAKIIVAVGRGLRSPDDIPMFEELAAKVGGVLACSRPLVEKGWFHASKQVGLSGRTVRPLLYVACGISGAVQHVAGMSESRTIVAINEDKHAPIFEVAHYALVADLYEVVPLILRALSEGDTDAAR